MNAMSFAEFEADALVQGFDEALVREWAPGTVVGTHSHPFEVQALVVRGELWLSVGEVVRHLRAGDPFALPPGVPHAERYGDDGATFWVARRHVPAGVTSSGPAAG